MNPANKKPPVKHVVAQLKTAAPSVKRPVAPPVYRPQPVPKVLQKKASPVQHPHAGQASRTPVAPPVYRPQAKPVIAQAKMAGNSQPGKHPVASPAYRSHAKPNVARRNSAVQRYSEVKVPGVGESKMSENEQYFIPNNDNGAVFVRSGALAPRSSEPQLTTKRYNHNRYQEYRSKDFINDCLHTAEEINAGAEYVPGSGVRSQVPGAPKPFGDDHKMNIELAKNYATDDKAAPGVGEAYVIVNKKWLQKVGKYPYHAAAVVAVDGEDRITLEVCATDEDAVMRDTKGTYNMYETKSARTFHSHWKGEFAKADPATLVIKPK